MYEARSGAANILEEDRSQGREALPRDDDGGTAISAGENRRYGARSETESSSGKKRNVNLDALRGIAILLVLGRHFKCFALWTKIGWAGVDLFFVLSGFLISGLLFAEWKRFGAIDVRRFYIRRAFKIYPPFYAYLVVTCVLLMLSHVPAKEVLRSAAPVAAFVQNYVPYGHADLWGHAWSLDVEEHFYIVLPLLLWLMQLRRSNDPFRLLVLVFGVIAIADVVLRFRTGASLSGQQYDIYYCPTHLRIDALLFGVLLSYSRHFYPDVFRRLSASWVTLCVAGAAIVALAILPLEDPAMHTAGLTLLYLGSGAALCLTIDRRFSGKAARIAGLLAGIGVYSYSIYLWHFFFALILPNRGAGFALLYIAVAIGFGIVAAKLIEVPTLRLRDCIFASRAA